MKFKILSVIFLAIVSLYSCTTFKSVKSQESVNGTFKAFYNQKEFDGFFSLSKNKFRLDIVNTFGFSVYGIYAQDDSVYLKDYQSGKVYRNLKINGSDLSVYKPFIIYTMKNFDNLCNITNKDILILSCKTIDKRRLPTSIIYKNKNSNKRFRINLNNIKIKVFRSLK